MAQFTLAEAAKAIGKSKSTVLRSIRAGRISAVRDELTGGWLIEPAELHRLYPENGPSHWWNRARISASSFSCLPA